MKRSNLILKFVLAISLPPCALNIHSQSPFVSNPFINPYDPGSDGFTLGMVNPFDKNSIAGEYLIATDHFEWAEYSNSGEFEIAYKIETVYFPFAPDCMKSTCIASQNRILTAGAGIKNQFTFPGYSLINRSPSLPSGVVNQVVAIQSGISERAKLESNMDYYAYTLNMLQADLFRAGIEELKLDSVISVLKEDDNKVNRENLFSAFLAAGDAGGADSVLTVIKNIVAEPATYEISMQTINLKMLKDTITATELDNTTLASIDLFSSNNPEQAYKAKALMKAAHGKKSKREPYSEVSVSNRSMETHQITHVAPSAIDFTLYPNPASDIINIQASEEGSYEITLYNQLGLTVVSQKAEGTLFSFDTQLLSPGVYCLVVRSEGQMLFSENIIIIKDN